MLFKAIPVNFFKVTWLLGATTWTMPDRPNSARGLIERHGVPS